MRSRAKTPRGERYVAMWSVNSAGREVRGKVPEGMNGRGNPLWRVIRCIVGLIDGGGAIVVVVADATRYYGRVRVMPILRVED